MDYERGFLATLIGDGRSLLKLTALVLIGSGGFIVFQALTGHFLPHDIAWLGMSAQELCAIAGCRVAHFMIHDRISFGGVLVAIGTMYLWRAEFPLRRGEAWAWRAFAISGIAGFLSFLTYLGYGYLDTWHLAGTILLLPVYIAGLVMTRKLITCNPAVLPLEVRSVRGAARTALLLATLGITAAGATIMTVGMTVVFVPQDLTFMGVTAAQLRAINRHLVPLIAHDRAGFGGALLSCGLVMFLSLLYAPLDRAFRQVLLLAGIAGFGTAIGVHPMIGYNDLTHLGPAIFGACVFMAGLAATGLSAKSAAA